MPIDSHHLVDALIAVLLVEWVALALWRRRRRPQMPPQSVRYSLLSGLALAIALRVVQAEGAWWQLALCLAAAGVFHALDLRERLHDLRGTPFR
jgi:hypothetical protein